MTALLVPGSACGSIPCNPRGVTLPVKRGLHFVPEACVGADVDDLVRSLRQQAVAHLVDLHTPSILWLRSLPDCVVKREHSSPPADCNSGS
jgi:hypothetical protein